MNSTQDKLLAISARLFAERGFSGVSMREIARSAGITQAAIYHHFANKEELYIATLEHLYQGPTNELVNVVCQESDPEVQLEILVSNTLEIFDRHAHFRRIYFRELLEGDNKRLKLLADGILGEINEFVRDVLAQLAPHMDKHLLMLDLGGLILHHLEARKLSAQMDSGRPEHQQLPMLAEHITSLILNGVRKP